MNSQQVTAIALKLTSIWLLIQLVLKTPSFFLLFESYNPYNQHNISMFVYAGILAAFFLIGLVAVYLINKAATSVLTQAKTGSESSLSNDSQMIFFQLAGLYFVVNAIVHLPSPLDFIDYADYEYVSSLPLGLVFQFVIGLWLACYSSFWLSFFQKLRK